MQEVRILAWSKVDEANGARQGTITSTRKEPSNQIIPPTELPMLLHRLRRLVGPVARPLYTLLRQLRYRRALRRGEPAGELTYTWSAEPPPAGPAVEARWPADVPSERGEDFCHQQTLTELRAVGLAPDGTKSWQVPSPDPHAPTPQTGWFYAPGAPPTNPQEARPGTPVWTPRTERNGRGEWERAFLETAMLLLAAEDVDALTLLPDPPGTLPQPATAHDLLVAPWRAHTLWSTAAYTYDPATDQIRVKPQHPRAPRVKVVPPCEPPREARFWNRHRRGAFLASDALPPRLEIAVRDAAGLGPPTFTGHQRRQARRTRARPLPGPGRRRTNPVRNPARPHPPLRLHLRHPRPPPERAR